jgi:hypothetical protein
MNLFIASIPLISWLRIAARLAKADLPVKFGRKRE